MAYQINDPGKPIDEQVLNQVEKQLNQKLSSDYRNFMVEHNGGRPELTQFSIHWKNQPWASGWDQDDVGDFYAVDEKDPLNLLDKANAYVGRIPSDTLPIGNDPFNNQLLLGVGSTNFGKVYLWMFSHEKDTDEPGPADYRNVGFVANTFNEFMNALRQSE